MPSPDQHTSLCVDSHVHLDRYPDADVERLLNRAARAGVAGVLTVGVDLQSSRRAVALATRFREPCHVYAAIGLHPAFLPSSQSDAISAITSMVEQLREMAHTSPATVVAIGEAGLDTTDSTAPLETQLHAFVAQLQIANALDLPVIIHVQGAESVARAQEVYATLPVRRGALVHYFVGGQAEARRWLDLGCHISVGKPILRLEHDALREAVAHAGLPLGRMLVETDTYPLPGRTTEPADVVAVASEIAALKHLRRQRVDERMMATFASLFRVAL